MISLFEKHPLLSFIIALFIAASIFYVSTWTGKSLGPPVSSWKAIGYHFFAFFFLCLFLLISLVQGKSKRISFIAIAIILSLAYGVLDEFHQLFVQGRSCSFSDFLIDSAGVYLASFFYVIRCRIKM